MSSRRIPPREMQVLRTYARLGNQKLVAAQLGINLQTVKNHLTSAYRTLEATSGIEAFTILGWLHAPTDEEAVVLDALLLARDLQAELVEISHTADAIAARLGKSLEASA